MTETCNQFLFFIFLNAVVAMAEGKMKLHGIASSTCTGRVLVTLFEKEVEDFELQVVNVRKGEGKTPEHMALQVS